MSIDSAVLLLNEAKEFLSDTIILSEKITQRGYALGVVMLAMIGGLTNKLFSLDYEQNFVLICFFMAAIGVSLVMVFYLYRLIFPFRIRPRGRMPADLNKEEYLIPAHLTKDQAYLSFVINEIQNTQTKIDFNTWQNGKRLKILKLLLILMFTFFSAFVAIYFLILITYQA